MKVIQEGYAYGLYNVDNPNQKGQIVQFIEKEPLAVGIGSMQKTKTNGTSLEEVLEVALAKANFENTILRRREMSTVATNIEQALLWLQRDKVTNKDLI